MAGKDTYAGRSLAELAAALHGSKAEFVRRLEDPRRRWVGDWERDGGIATHKMAWRADDHGNAMVYPMVQEIDGELVDFTDPSVNGGDAGMGARSAVGRGDYAVMTPEEADFFTRSYKGYYPKGDTFGDAAPDGYDIDFSQLAGTGGRTFNSRYLNYIMKSLLGRGVAPVQAAAILGTIAEESGGDPFAASESGEYNGLLQWGRDRYAPSLLSDGDPFAEIDRQLDHLCKTLGDTADGKSWTHGGEGSGYVTAADAQLDWAHPADLWHAVRSLNRGYVRPAGGERSALNRYGVADKAYALMRGRERRMKADMELEESAAKSKGVMADEAAAPATWDPGAVAGTMLELPPVVVNYGSASEQSQYSRGGRLYQDGGVFGGTFTPMVELPALPQAVAPYASDSTASQTVSQMSLQPQIDKSLASYDVEVPYLPKELLPAEEPKKPELINDNVLHLIEGFFPLERKDDEFRVGDRLYAYQVKLGKDKDGRPIYEKKHTIGNGLVLEDNPDVKNVYDRNVDENGVHFITTDDNLRFWRDKYVNEALPIAKYIIDKRYGKGTFASLPDAAKAMFMDYAYNMKYGLAGFPKFMDATLAGDKETMLKEFRRRDSVTKRLLGERNDYFEQYINDYF